VFFELNWEAADWAEREQAAAALLASLRQGQAGRATRLVAILQQSKSQSEVPDGKQGGTLAPVARAHSAAFPLTSPAVPTAIIEERARSLRSACKLMTKSSLFTLDTPDARLQTAMHK
jgi:hypothetical protein